MSPDANREVVRDFYERVINRRDVAAIDELLTEGFVHNGERRGRDGQRAAVEAFLAGFSDLRNEIEQTVVEGDLVAARQTWTGTHDGEFMGAPPSGREVTFASTAILRIEDGAIAEAWDVIDIGLASQLGP